MELHNILIEVVTMIYKVEVNCERNTELDIRCGGAATLGFDFYVKEKDLQKSVDFIKETLIKYNRPLMNIIASPSKLKETRLWTLGMIEEAIKEGY